MCNNMFSMNNLESLSDSKGNIVCNYKYYMTMSWVYDYAFMLIENKNIEYFLSKRENTFLNILLNKRGIITYSEMVQILSTNHENLTKNAIRLFIKNFRKKLPKDSIKNIQGVGYKLVL